jgi:hypothetical protein
MDGLLQDECFFALGVVSFRVRPMIGYFVVQPFRARFIAIVRGNLMRYSFLSQNHERRIDGDAREPGSETGSAVKVLYMKKRSQQGVLNRVFRVLAASGDPARGTKELLSISLENCVEGPGMPALGGFHKARIAQSASAATWRATSFC